MPHQRFKEEVEKYLTGESEHSELIYFKVYKSQMPVIEQALDTAAPMLGSDKSRGYCLEMICADFLAGARADNDDAKVLLLSMLRLSRFLPNADKQEFLAQVADLSQKARRSKVNSTLIDRYYTVGNSRPRCQNR